MDSRINHVIFLSVELTDWLGVPSIDWLMIDDKIIDLPVHSSMGLCN